jgi:hypothetical protein
MFLDLRKYIVDKEFQYSYIIQSLFLLLFVVASTFLVILVWNKFRFYHGYLLSPPREAELTTWAVVHRVPTDSMEFAFQYVAQAKPYTFYNLIIGPILVIFAVNVVVIAIVSLRTSYKIAIPLHEFKMALRRKVERGEIEKPLVVRKDDPFQELASLANLAFIVAHNPGIKEFVNFDDDEPAGPSVNYGRRKDDKPEK